MKYEDLLALESPQPADVDAFLAANDVPLVRPGRVIYVYRGAATAVRLRQWIHGLPADPALDRLGDTDLWYLECELPDGSRVEYKFEIEDENGTRWTTDPLNPELAEDPFGANSVCHGYGYRRPSWSLPDAGGRPGTLDRLTIASRSFGEKRRTQVYLPARFRRTRRYPLLIVHDGSDFLRFAAFNAVLDNLIHRMEVAPMIVALTDPGNRNVEYAADDRHATYIADELFPALAARFNLEDHPDARGLMGASFGAVASLHASWRRPELFGRLMLLSGSFAFSDIGGHHRGPVFDPVVRFVNAFRHAPARPAQRVYMSCGIYESLIYENRSILPLLRDTGARVRYDEARDGHNWENWRDRQQKALSWLFRGPLWMTYE